MYFVNVEGIQVNKLFFVMPRTPTLWHAHTLRTLTHIHANTLNV